MTYDLPPPHASVAHSASGSGSGNSNPTPTTRIAIIGAGISGLAQIQQLTEIWAKKNVERRTRLELVVFESKDEVGGVWLTDDQPKHSVRTHLPVEADTANGPEPVEQVYSYPPKNENPSPMYHGLRTNLAHDLMSFRGFPFPEGTALFPDQPTIQKYLEAFADAYNLRDYIRFNTRVERVYLTPTPTSSGKHKRRWTIESAPSISSPHANAAGGEEKKSEEFDYVCVANGHYSDGWIPAVCGLSSYPGRLIHSRFFFRASDYVGQSVLVVGSFASGGDISRLIATLNVGKYTPAGEPVDSTSGQTSKGGGFTKVHVSSSGTTPHSASSDGPWAPYITYVPLIERVDPPSSAHPNGLIHFTPLESGETVAPLEAPDTIIYATGYNFHYPFFKSADSPWSGSAAELVSGQVRGGERKDGDTWEEGGLKGQGIRGLDELLMFLKDDRTIAFPVLAYQVVPFPLAQVQARLVAYLWAGLLPSFPAHPKLPPNPSNPYSQKPSSGDGPRPDPTSPEDPPSSASSILQSSAVNGNGSTQTQTQTQTKSQAEAEAKAQIDANPQEKPRKVLEKMRELVFGAEYEWTYTEFLMGLYSEAEKGKEGEVEEHWKKVEDWRRARREDGGLRKRTLGY